MGVMSQQGDGGDDKNNPIAEKSSCDCNPKGEESSMPHHSQENTCTISLKLTKLTHSY